MNERPALTNSLSADEFISYYYLKSELEDFCRNAGLPASGNKEALTRRIAYYLETGELTGALAAKRVKHEISRITLDTPIESPFVCSEKHRAFFKEHLGNSFHFNTGFQEWLKTNSGKTYAEALDAYRKIQFEKKKSKRKIGKQFEYNSYIRAFFADNPGRTLNEAITCWNYKKSLKGSHTYKKTDLSALNM